MYLLDSDLCLFLHFTFFVRVFNVQYSVFSVHLFQQTICKLFRIFVHLFSYLDALSFIRRRVSDLASVGIFNFQILTYFHPQRNRKQKQTQIANSTLVSLAFLCLSVLNVRMTRIKMKTKIN